MNTLSSSSTGPSSCQQTNQGIKKKRKSDDAGVDVPVSQDIDQELSSDVEVVKRYTAVNCSLCSITQWLRLEHGEEKQNKAVLPLVDLRSTNDFSKRSISLVSCDDENESVKNLCVVNLPFDSLLQGERSCELPPRAVPFAIMVPKSISMELICKFFFAKTSKCTGQSRVPWNVKQIVRESEQVWNDLKRISLIANSSENASNIAPRLWKPDPLVENHILPMLKTTISEWFAKQSSANPTANPHTNDITHQSIMGEVWDLGSGAGRDICFLSEELKHFCQNSFSIECPIHFVGIDNHKGSARRSIPFWRNRSVSDIVKSTNINLKKLDKFESILDELVDNGRELVFCYAVRYLNSHLMDYIAKNDHVAIKRGTNFGISHFCMKEDGLWNFDHPRVNSVLKYNELPAIFCKENGWKVDIHLMCEDSDAGRTMTNFIATKVNK